MYVYICGSANATTNLWHFEVVFGTHFVQILLWKFRDIVYCIYIYTYTYTLTSRVHTTVSWIQSFSCIFAICSYFSFILYRIIYVYIYIYTSVSLLQFCEWFKHLSSHGIAQQAATQDHFMDSRPTTRQAVFSGAWSIGCQSWYVTMTLQLLYTGQT